MHTPVTALLSVRVSPNGFGLVEMVKSMQASLPTGTVTFLFTDIENSTPLAQQYPAELPSILGQHHAILRQSIEAHNGSVFQIVGDGFCAAFFTATDAVNAALEAQRQLQQAAWIPVALKVRMGIHTGPAQAGGLQDAAGAYTGYLTLTRTQRVMSTAYGGQVLISAATAELCRGELPESAGLRDMGEHRLKGLLNPERLWQLTAAELLSEFPALKSLNSIPNNLPVQLNSFIGRERELAQTKDMLSKAHLLTLIGPGGTGKTRLSLQLAAEVLPEFADGVWLVELAPLADPALMLQTIAETLGLREIPGMALKALVTEFLRDKHALLILDNCEHLVEISAQLADHLLQHCAALKIIASSREALGIAGESVYRVPPLTLPDADASGVETLRHSEAVQLFIERAAAAKAGFGLLEHNAPAVAKICRRLDGIPLALELAAARVGMLTPEQIATRLDDRFKLLTGGSRTALPRQQTLRSLIDWSYNLLSTPERDLFCRLAVFVGGWSLEAAEAVCLESDVLGLMTQLVQKSLVAADSMEGELATRFRLLETIRQYSRDRLLEMEDSERVRDLHLDYYVMFAEAGEPKFFGPQRLEWMNQCEMEYDNFRAAMQWGLDRRPEATVRLAGSLVTFWGTRGFNQEGRQYLRTGLDQTTALPDPQGEMQATFAKGWSGLSQLSYADGDYHDGLEASQEAVRLYRQLGNQAGLAFALCTTGNMAAFQDKMTLAENALTEAISIGREIGDKATLCYGLGVLSHFVLLPRGDIAAARACAVESERFARELGLTWGEGQTEMVLARIDMIEGKWNEARTRAQTVVDISQGLRDDLLLNMGYSELGDIELGAGNLDEARRYHRQSIIAMQKLGQQAFVIHGLEGFALIAQAQNQPARAARLLGAVEALIEGTGISAVGIFRMQNEYEKAVAWLHAQLDESAYRTYWTEGRTMSMDRAVAYALEA